MNTIIRLVLPVAAAAVVFPWMFFAGGARILESSIGAALSLIITGIITYADRIFKKWDQETFLFGGVGLLAGLAGSYFITDALSGELRAYAPAFAVVFGITGVIAGLGYVRGGIRRVVTGTAGGGFTGEGNEGFREKILDTSVVIDGRILDIADTNFIEGPMVIPNFVLREIQLISDSADPIKRNRGRRGLEMLNKLQQQGNVKVKISYVDYADARDVDQKLVRLARETGGKLVTNDFNLQKIAELQGVEVLNLNNLTSALKPVVLPGEELVIDVIKEGKDENQGIGYLEDGTMVVVENGRALLGKTVKVNVTSIIQTAAGKMIFTRATGAVVEKEEEKDHGNDDRGRNRGGNSNGGRFGGGGNYREGGNSGGGNRDDYQRSGGRRR